MVTRLLIFIAFTLTCTAQPWWTPPVQSQSSVAGPVAEGLFMWYDADSLALTDGALVTNWTDRSVSGFTLSNTANDAQPFWTNDVSVLGGKAWLQFDGSSDTLFHGGGHHAQTNVYFIVAQASAFESGDAVCGGTNSSYRGQLILNTLGRWWAYSGASGCISANNSTKTNQWYLLEVTYAGANSEIKTNGTTLKVGDAGSQALAGFRVGADHTGAGSWFAGGIAEILVYSGAVSEDTRSVNRAYFTNKYGLYTTW